MIRVIAKRYAKALVELAEEQKTSEKISQDLRAFVGAMDSQPAVDKLFRSPAVTPEDKKAVIHEIAQRMNLQPTTARFIEFLAENGRIRYIREVQQAFEDLLAERQNRVVVELTSATAMNNGYLSDIKGRLERITGKNIDIKTQIDTSLIAGVKAKIGSVIYDGSIRNQLNRMREQMGK